MAGGSGSARCGIGGGHGRAEQVAPLLELLEVDVHLGGVLPLTLGAVGTAGAVTLRTLPSPAVEELRDLEKSPRASPREPATPPKTNPHMSRHRLRYLLPAAILMVVLAGGAFAGLETRTVGSFGEGIWWALSLVTTVGFVGQTPVTTPGRVLAGLLMVFGFALLSLTTAAVASLFVREDETSGERRDAAFEHQALAELRALGERLDRLERTSGGPEVRPGRSVALRESSDARMGEDGVSP